jgi:PIN domain nuclease of toxin-antitoxin system
MGRVEVILLDTHVVVWLAFEPNRISRKAKLAIERARTNAEGLAISDITLLELATLVNKGRIRIDISLDSFLLEIESRFIVLPMNARVCARSMEMKSAYPQDPADRIIGATALVAGLQLLTADNQIQRSKVVDTIW